MAPISIALAYSSYGVSFDEKMISSPVIPTFSHRISSANEEQSAPTPSFCNKRIIYGFGVAFTAKYSLKSLAQLKALIKRRILSTIPFASYI